MAKYKNNLIQLDIEKLFREHSIEDITEVEKLLDGEIEKKRLELRSMVGERYKDILAASDAIKSMESISEHVVDDIQEVTDRCENLVQTAGQEIPLTPFVVDTNTIRERTILIHIRLTLIINDHIWMALDLDDYSKAAQFYLLAQHVHTGLRLLSKNVMEKYSLIKQIKRTVESLRQRILAGVNNMLQTVELSTEDTCSNLNALMLLENYSGTELMCKFIELRQSALQRVMGTSHETVRAQISAMVRCLYTTVYLLHDCFVSYEDSNKGLIWHQLDSIVSENTPTTLSLVSIPESPLIVYIPEIIKQFRPKCGLTSTTFSKSEAVSLIKKWVDSTISYVQLELKTPLEIVTNVKGLHIIREEALKIEIHENWHEICLNADLPKSFNIWFYFFQEIITNRVRELMTVKMNNITNTLQDEIKIVLQSASTAEKSEADLRWYSWYEESMDVSRTETQHLGLSMKTMGISPNIVNLSKKMDIKFFDLLKDVCMYLYGKEFDKDTELFLSFALKNSKHSKKFYDREKLEQHLKQECVTFIDKLVSYLETLIKPADPNFVTKSIICARFLRGITSLCENFKKCCTCNYSSDEWTKMCSTLNKSSLMFWQNWIKHCSNQTAELSSRLLSEIDMLKMLTILARWDVIEIQEQADDKVFKSEIRVPMTTSLALHEILQKMNDMINAVLPHTLPKQVQLKYIEENTLVVLNQYEILIENTLNQMQALQFLFDVKFMTTFCIPRENMELAQKSQETCDKLRSKIDPFDLDVFYKYLQHNVKQCVLQSQVILGCLLPSSGQLSSLGVLEKNKYHEKDPSILALSIPSTNTWFSLLPVTAPVQKTALPTTNKMKDNKVTKTPSQMKKPNENAGAVRSGAAALFGAMATDWFS